MSRRNDDLWDVLLSMLGLIGLGALLAACILAAVHQECAS
jgi:hypothetical protein